MISLQLCITLRNTKSYKLQLSFSDGDKFSERREFYKVLQRVEAILDLYAAEGADTRVVEDIVSLTHCVTSTVDTTVDKIHQVKDQCETQFL